MEESDNEPLKETDKENEIKTRSSIRKKKQEKHEKKQYKFPKITKNSRATKNIRFPRFREV